MKNRPVIQTWSAGAAGMGIGFGLALLTLDHHPSATFRKSPESEEAAHEAYEPGRVSAFPAAASSRSGGLQELSLRDVQGRIEDLRKAGSEIDRLAPLLQRWAQLDGPGALAQVTGWKEGPSKQAGMAAIAEVLARRDPEALALESLNLPPSRTTLALVKKLAEIWSERDASAALEWARQLPPGPQREEALFQITTRIAVTDPQAAAREIPDLPDNSSTSALIASIAGDLASGDPAAAMRWAQSLPDTKQIAAISGATEAWAKVDPAAAAIAVAQLPAGEGQNEAIRLVISQWAAKDPQTAGEWIRKFPPGDLRREGMREVVSQWTVRDEAGALRWVQSQPDAFIRDEAMVNYISEVAYFAPEKAAQAAATVQDRAKRIQSLEIAARCWAQVDPAAARNWMLHLSDYAEQRDRLEPLFRQN